MNIEWSALTKYFEYNKLLDDISLATLLNPET